MNRGAPSLRAVIFLSFLILPVVFSCKPRPSAVLQPESQTPGADTLPEPLRQELKRKHLESYDPKGRGWGLSYKYVDAFSVEYAMQRGLEGSAIEQTMARETLNAGMKLLDPAGGGVYQYSVGGWDEPHFKKIMSVQADNLRVYALGYALWKNPPYLNAAREIHRYLASFLKSPEGAFYTSHDAGRVIDALAVFYSATGEGAYLAEAVGAAKWISENRALFGGGFSRAAQEADGPYLGDTLAMARAFVSLYSVTGERMWLEKAEDAAAFIHKKFKIEKNGHAGFSRAAFSRLKPATLTPESQRDENIHVVLLADSLFHYTGREKHHRMARHAMRYLTLPEIARQGFASGVLLADRVMTRDPIHITVVGPKSDPRSAALFKAALKYPAPYRRQEWWDPKEGLLPNPDVRYPDFERPAAFLCTGTLCSSPIFEPSKISEQLQRLSNKTD